MPTPLEVASGYTAIANGGFKVEPWLIDRIEDVDGNIIYEADPLIACAACERQVSDDEFLEASESRTC